MSTSPCTPLEQVGDLSDNLRAVLEGKMASARKACTILAQHKDPPGLAEAIIEYEVAASLKDPAEARRLNYEYQDKFKAYLDEPQGSEAEETIANSMQTLLNVMDCIRRLENSIRLRASANHEVEEQACAAVTDSLIDLYHTTRDELDGGSPQPSAAGGATVVRRKSRSSRLQPRANALPGLSEAVEAGEAGGAIAEEP
ncbi:hypothetical protein JCM8208_007186 [Rhodotorula glutinis]